MLKTTVLAVFVALLSSPVFAQLGDLLADSSFNFTSTVEMGAFYTNKLLIDNEDRILCAGFIIEPAVSGGFERDYMVCRLLSDGSYDASFANQGCLRLDFGFDDESLWNIERHGQGYLVVGQYGITYGTSNYVQSLGSGLIMKITEEGSLDPEFGTDGIVTLPLDTQYLVADIKINLAGEIYILINRQSGSLSALTGIVLKLDAQGELDQDFGNQGISLLPLSFPHRMNLLSDGGIVVLAADSSAVLSFPYNQGSNWFAPHLCRLLPSGVLDSGFGVNGKVLVSHSGIGFHTWHSVSAPDGFYLYGLENYNPWTYDNVYRINNDGVFDPSFGTEGRMQLRIGTVEQGWGYVWLNYFRNMKVFNGDLWITGATEIYNGNCQRKAIVRVTQAGEQDTTLGPYRFSAEPIFDAVLSDSAYNNPYVYCSGMSGWNDIVFQSDGKIIAAGWINNNNGWDTLTTPTIPSGSIVSRLIADHGIVTEVGVRRNDEGLISVYPNPVDEILSVSASDCNLAWTEIYDMQGKLMELVPAQTGSWQVTVDVSGLRSGVYVLQILCHDSKRSAIFVKR